MTYTPSSDCLKDQVILVTGAGEGGLGSMAAKQYAKHGATVILLGRKIPKLEKTYDAIVNAGHTEPAIYPLTMDGATENDYYDLANVIEENFGRLDGILHNAAAIGELTPFANHDGDVWLKTIQVNLNAPFLITQACMPLLMKSENASIVFTDHDCKGAYWGAYGISKTAAKQFALSLALECDGNPRVNLISPGALISPMRSRAYPGDNLMANPEMDVVAPAYIYLMDQASKEMNGELIEAQEFIK